MKNSFKKLLLTTTTLSLFIVSCGQDVCVSGIGKCDVPKEITDKQNNVQTGTGPAAIKSLKAAFQTDRVRVSQGEQITLVGVGGTPPYTFAMSTDSTTGKVGETDGVFTAPRIKATAKVKITDDTKTSTEIQIDIP